MQQCKAIGCLAPALERRDFCADCTFDKTVSAQVREAPSGRGSEPVRETSSGGDNDYWIARITYPKRLEPYEAECEDIIEHFRMTFQEGEAFKALWRKGQARIGNGKPGDTPLRNAQKVKHFGARMTVMEERELEEA